MLEIQHYNADLDCFRIFILPETSKTQNQRQVDSEAYSEVTRSWQEVGCCKKQTSVLHSSTEAEIIHLDAGLRMDGIPVIDLWDLVIEVFHSSPQPIQQH